MRIAPTFRFAPILLLVVAACKPAAVAPDNGNSAKNGAITLPTKAGAAVAPSTPGTALTAYVGKYPDDKVDGVAFKDVPAVKAAVDAAVPDKAIAATILAFAGPNTPIANKDGRLLAHGCETHNCGTHNWTIAITPDGAGANVCYKTDDAAAPRWFGANPPQSDDDSCPSGDS